MSNVTIDHDGRRMTSAPGKIVTTEYVIPVFAGAFSGYWRTTITELDKEPIYINLGPGVVTREQANESHDATVKEVMS